MTAEDKLKIVQLIQTQDDTNIILAINIALSLGMNIGVLAKMCLDNMEAYVDGRAGVWYSINQDYIRIIENYSFNGEYILQLFRDKSSFLVSECITLTQGFNRKRLELIGMIKLINLVK